LNIVVNVQQSWVKRFTTPLWADVDLKNFSLRLNTSMKRKSSTTEVHTKNKVAKHKPQTDKSPKRRTEEVVSPDPFHNESLSVENPDPEVKPPSHAVQRALAKERKQSKPHFKTLHEAKLLWESLRQQSQPKAEQQAQITQLFSLLQGQIPSLAFNHSASRLVQTAMKLGTKEQRGSIARELKGTYVELAKSKYGKFLVTKVLEYGYTRSRCGLK
jgi:hypothetical protein